MSGGRSSRQGSRNSNRNRLQTTATLPPTSLRSHASLSHGEGIHRRTSDLQVTYSRLSRQKQAAASENVVKNRLSGKSGSSQDIHQRSSFAVPRSAEGKDGTNQRGHAESRNGDSTVQPDQRDNQARNPLSMWQEERSSRLISPSQQVCNNSQAHVQRVQQNIVPKTNSRQQQQTEKPTSSRQCEPFPGQDLTYQRRSNDRQVDKSRQLARPAEEWGDEDQWVVECPCGVTYDDGAEMVECDVCRVWVHTACCGVPKDCDTYVCARCRQEHNLVEDDDEEKIAKLVAERPSKPPVPSKSRLQARVYRFGSRIPIEGLAHVHGVPGGEEGSLVGASKVFSRQLWMHVGLVPKPLPFHLDEIPPAVPPTVSQAANLWMDSGRVANSAIGAATAADMLELGVQLRRLKVPVIRSISREVTPSPARSAMPGKLTSAPAGEVARSVEVEKEREKERAKSRDRESPSRLREGMVQSELDHSSRNAQATAVNSSEGSLDLAVRAEATGHEVIGNRAVGDNEHSEERGATDVLSILTQRPHRLPPAASATAEATDAVIGTSAVSGESPRLRDAGARERGRGASIRSQPSSPMSFQVPQSPRTRLRLTQQQQQSPQLQQQEEDNAGLKAKQAARYGERDVAEDQARGFARLVEPRESTGYFEQGLEKEDERTERGQTGKLDSRVAMTHREANAGHSAAMDGSHMLATVTSTKQASTADESVGEDSAHAVQARVGASAAAVLAPAPASALPVAAVMPCSEGVYPSNTKGKADGGASPKPRGGKDGMRTADEEDCSHEMAEKKERGGVGNDGQVQELQGMGGVGGLPEVAAVADAVESLASSRVVSGDRGVKGLAVSSDEAVKAAWEGDVEGEGGRAGSQPLNGFSGKEGHHWKRDSKGKPEAEEAEDRSRRSREATKDEKRRERTPPLGADKRLGRAGPEEQAQVQAQTQASLCPKRGAQEVGTSVAGRVERVVLQARGDSDSDAAEAAYAAAGVAAVTSVTVHASGVAAPACAAAPPAVAVPARAAETAGTASVGNTGNEERKVEGSSVEALPALVSGDASAAVPPVSITVPGVVKHPLDGSKVEAATREGRVDAPAAAGATSPVAGDSKSNSKLSCDPLVARPRGGSEEKASEGAEQGLGDGREGTEAAASLKLTAGKLETSMRAGSTSITCSSAVSETGMSVDEMVSEAVKRLDRGTVERTECWWAAWQLLPSACGAEWRAQGSARTAGHEVRRIREAKEALRQIGVHFGLAVPRLVSFKQHQQEARERERERGDEHRQQLGRDKQLVQHQQQSHDHSGRQAPVQSEKVGGSVYSSGAEVAVESRHGGLSRQGVDGSKESRRREVREAGGSGAVKEASRESREETAVLRHSSSGSKREASRGTVGAEIAAEASQGSAPGEVSKQACPSSAKEEGEVTGTSNVGKKAADRKNGTSDTAGSEGSEGSARGRTGKEEHTSDGGKQGSGRRKEEEGVRKKKKRKVLSYDSDSSRAGHERSSKGRQRERERDRERKIDLSREEDGEEAGIGKRQKVGEDGTTGSQGERQAVKQEEEEDVSADLGGGGYSSVVHSEGEGSEDGTEGALSWQRRKRGTASHTTDGESGGAQREVKNERMSGEGSRGAGLQDDGDGVSSPHKQLDDQLVPRKRRTQRSLLGKSSGEREQAGQGREGGTSGTGVSSKQVQGKGRDEGQSRHGPTAGGTSKSATRRTQVGFAKQLWKRSGGQMKRSSSEGGNEEGKKFTGKRKRDEGISDEEEEGRRTRSVKADSSRDGSSSGGGDDSDEEDERDEEEESDEEIEHSDGDNEAGGSDDDDDDDDDEDDDNDDEAETEGESSDQSHSYERYRNRSSRKRKR